VVQKSGLSKPVAIDDATSKLDLSSRF
jgi:hypothetical protein